MTTPGVVPVTFRVLSPDERDEMQALGVLDIEGQAARCAVHRAPCTVQGIPKRAVQAHDVLNEAYAYARPSSFSRAIRFDLGDKTMVMISGTASIDEHGQTAHVGDFRAQLWRTYRNITGLLSAERATWHDVVRTSCYLRDIERDYKDFNEVRTAFFTWLGLDPLPASTGIQARLCREDLLVEIEAIAVFGRR